MAKKYDKNTELRCVPASFTVEKRVAPVDGGMEPAEPSYTIVGYAALFNTVMRTSSMREMIAPGAFDGVLGDDVRCLFNHEDCLLLGRTKSGTVRLSVDDVGLRYECDLPDTDLAEDLVEWLTRGDVAESSFAFTIAPDGEVWTYPVDDVPLRTVTKLSRLYDVSPVTYPAYDTTSVALRSMEMNKPTQVEKTDFVKLKINLLKTALGD